MGIGIGIGGKMTSSELKALYERYNPEGFFFCRKTMKFFGDTMRNFSVIDGGHLLIMTDTGIEKKEVWALYRKRPVNGGRHGFCAYFRKDNGQQVFNHE